MCINKGNLPIITLVGQRNVGKSTLFNRLTCTNAAVLSNNSLGCTRDRQYGYIKNNKYRSIIIDTGSFDILSKTKIQNAINNQIILAVKEAHIIFFVVDGIYRVSTVDYSIIGFLRKFKTEIFLLVNKIDNIYIYNEKYMVYDYYALGVKNVFAISAIHGYGVDHLLKQVFLKISKISNKSCAYDTFDILDINQKNKSYERCNKLSACDGSGVIKLAIIGRPNSGKSTFINFLLKKNRMITSSIPGTTRDSVCIPAVYNNQNYILIDTAGVRKKKNIDNIIERSSVEKTLQILKNTCVTLFMIDAVEGIVDQDLILLRLIKNNSKSLIVAINKWDTSTVMGMRKDVVESIFRSKVRFLDFVKVHFISSLYGNGIKFLFRSVVEVHNLSNKIFTTSQLNRIMYESIAKNPPPLISGTRVIPKPKYVHIGSYNPIIIVIHGTQVTQLSNEYKRYLKKCFYKDLCITGICMRIIFKDTVNPFVTKI